MSDFSQAFSTALALALGADPDLWTIVALSLRVSVAAALCGALLGTLLGAWLAITQFPGRNVVVVVLNALMGLPSVVVGLVVYLLLSRAGPLGSMGILFTPTAMIIAQTLLITPTIAALTRQIISDAWLEYREQLISLGARPYNAALTLLWDMRFSLLTVVLAGFGRAASEVGAVMIVGGNIDGVTRVMTTAIALETTKGDLPLALALGLVLLVIILIINICAFATKRMAQRRGA